MKKKWKAASGKQAEKNLQRKNSIKDDPPGHSQEVLIIFTHGVRCSALVLFVFVTDGRTDTMRENNEHLFGRGPVGQKSAKEKFH